MNKKNTLSNDNTQNQANISLPEDLDSIIVMDYRPILLEPVALTSTTATSTTAHQANVENNMIHDDRYEDTLQVKHSQQTSNISSKSGLINDEGDNHVQTLMDPNEDTLSPVSYSGETSSISYELTLIDDFSIL